MKLETKSWSIHDEYVAAHNFLKFLVEIITKIPIDHNVSIEKQSQWIKSQILVELNICYKSVLKWII